MDLFVINPYQFSIQPHNLFDRQMVLLTCGDFATGGLQLHDHRLGFVWHNVERSSGTRCSTPKPVYNQFHGTI